MLKTLGTIASISAAHLAQAEQVLTEEVRTNPLPGSDDRNEIASSQA